MLGLMGHNRIYESQDVEINKWLLCVKLRDKIGLSWPEIIDKDCKVG